MYRAFKLWQVIRILWVEALDQSILIGPLVSYLLYSFRKHKHTGGLLIWHALELHTRFFSCCAPVWLADWDRQVWLCQCDVPVFLVLLSLAAVLQQKYRIQMWKIQFAKGIPVSCQHDLSCHLASKWLQSLYIKMVQFCLVVSHQSCLGCV